MLNVNVETTSKIDKISTNFTQNLSENEKDGILANLFDEGAHTVLMPRFVKDINTYTYSFTGNMFRNLFK